MLGRMRSGALLAAVAMMGAMSMPALSSPPPTVMRAPARPSKAAKRGLFGGLRMAAPGYGRKGAGITMAQQQRTAAKKRSVARNRRNHR